MLSIPYIHGRTPAERNATRTKEVDRFLGDIENALAQQIKAVQSVREAMKDPESYGDDEALPTSLIHGRRDWMARLLADDLLRYERGIHDDTIAAVVLASSYEVTDPNPNA